MGKQSQSIGREAQEQVSSVLVARGFKMVRTIGTPAKMVKGRMIYEEKVAGDHRAILPGGRSVLVETKARFSDDRFRYHFLKPHQVKSLQEHHDLGGVSLIAWVSCFGIFIMQWPVNGFEKGRPISLEMARSFDIMKIKHLIP